MTDKSFIPLTKALEYDEDEGPVFSSVFSIDRYITARGIEILKDATFCNGLSKVNNLDVVRFCLQKGLSPCSYTLKKEPIFFQAARKGNARLLALYLNEDIYAVNALNSSGKSVLMEFDGKLEFSVLKTIIDFKRIVPTNF